MIRRLCVTWSLCLSLAPTAPFAVAAEHQHGTFSVSAAGAVPLYTGLGNVRHTVTTRDPLAQRYFNQGLALCYAFNHDEAIRAFREAARLDPGCAMAHWGIALPLGPNVNLPVDPDREIQAYEEVRKAIDLSRKATLRERAYIQALATRYSDDPMADLHALDVVAEQDTLHCDEPPPWYYPVRQSLGAALLKAGSPIEAETVYREDLKRNPANGWSLYGLAQSLNARGRVTEATQAQKRFEQAWARADVKLEASTF